MAKSTSERLRHYRHAVARHVRAAIRREEPLKQAANGVVVDTRKLVNKLRGKHEIDSRHKAKAYVSEGAQAYKKQNFARAEASFRKAVELDAHYALAWLYLGNTLYKRNCTTQAVEAWHKATAAEPHSEAAETAAKRLTKLGCAGDLGEDIIAALHEHSGAPM
ncbi:MAG: hypothetical protein ACLFTT_14225 [Candidatus Hydrogenedentota bacterium]